MQLSPAEYVIHVFGGVRATARALGVEPSTVSKWQNRDAKGGSRGQLPSSVQRKILDTARAANLDLTASDLICGREIENVDKA